MIGWPVDERFAPTRIAFDMCSRRNCAGAAVTLPSARTMLPGPGDPGCCGPYGNGVASVVGVSGSCSSRRSFHTVRPFPAPSAFWRPDRSCAREASAPPPAPKRAPRRQVVATTSTRFQSGTGSLIACRCALIPATYASMSFSSCVPASTGSESPSRRRLIRVIIRGSACMGVTAGSGSPARTPGGRPSRSRRCARGSGPPGRPRRAP